MIITDMLGAKWTGSVSYESLAGEMEMMARQVLNEESEI